MWLLELNGISEFGRCGFCFSRALIRKHFPPASNLPVPVPNWPATALSCAPLAGKRRRVLHFEHHQTREDGFSYLWLPNFLNSGATQLDHTWSRLEETIQGLGPIHLPETSAANLSIYATLHEGLS